MKRITGLLLAAVLVLTQMPIFAQGETVFEEDSENKELLCELGIFGDEELSVEKITRKQCVKLLVELVGVDPQIFVYGTLPFSDISVEDEGYPYVCAAYNLGYISGSSSDMFEPENHVTKEQVAKMIMAILGYGEICESRGGYPAGYMHTASAEGLFSGLRFSSDDYVTGSEFANIAMNALDIELLDINIIGNSKTYEKRENETLLSANHHIFHDEALIDADRYTSIYTYTGTGSDTFLAENEEYDIKEYSGQIPVGYTCDIYYRQNAQTDSRKVLYLRPVPGRNRETVVPSDDMVMFNSNSVAYYNDKGAQKTVKIADNASFLYNAQFCGAEKALQAEADELTLVDNNDDGLADVVSIKYYTIVHVQSVSKETLSVYDRISRKNYRLDNTAQYETRFIYMDKITDFYEIEKDAVLSIMLPMDKTLLYAQYVYINDNYVDGIVKTVYPEGKKIIIDDVEYTANANVLDVVKAGDKRRFYFDCMDRIAAIQSSEEAGKYAYLAVIGNRGAWRINVELYTAEGQWLETSLASHIKYNGMKIDDKNIYQMSELFEEGKLKKQLIEYSVDSDGFVNQINTAKNLTAVRFTDEEAVTIDHDTFRLSYESDSSRYYGSGIKTFGDKAYINDDAVIIAVPKEGEGGKGDYAILTPTSLYHYTLYENIKVYNADTLGCSSLIVLNDSVTIPTSNAPLLVTDVLSAYSQERGEVQRLVGYNGAYEISYDFAEGKSIENILSDDSGLEPGDVIMLRTNRNKEIINFIKIFDFSASEYGVSDSITTYAENANIYGEVLAINPTYVAVNYASEKGSFSLNGTPIYICRIGRDGKRTIKVGSVNDIEVSDDVFLRSNWLKCKMAVVYKQDNI